MRKRWLRLPEQVVGSSYEETTEEKEGGEAELVERVVLHAGHHGEEEEGEYLGQVGGAGQECELLHDGRLAEHSPHLTVVELADEEPGGGVESDTDLPHIFLGSKVTDGSCGEQNEGEHLKRAGNRIDT